MNARGALIAATAAVLAGCGHGEPFQPGDYHPVEPLVPGAVARLTYNPGRDQSSSWSSGGILYTFEQQTGVFRSWCLGLLPGAGGSRTRSWCTTVTDSQIAYDWATEAGGRLAYLRASGVPFAMTPVTWSVTVSEDGTPEHGVALSPVVVTVPGAPGVQAAEQLRWLDSTTLVWVGALGFVGSQCRGCPVDTITSGRVLLTQDIRQPGLPTVLPGTDYATSVAVRGPDELLYTRGGSAYIYRLVVSTGVSTVLHDLSAFGIVRGVQVSGDVIVAVVGGAVSFGLDPLFGDSAQADPGGNLVVLDMVTGTTTLIQLAFSIRDPALAPDGRRVTVQSAATPEDVFLVALP